MESHTSTTGFHEEYLPPSGDPKLLSIYCGGCGASCICAEKETGSACGHPSEYGSEDFHPATTPKVANLEALRFPPPVSQPQVAVPSAIVIAKKALPSLDRRIAVHADCLTGTIESVENGFACLIGEDDVIKKLWDRHGSLGRRLATAGYRTVIAPAYSTYWSSTPLDGHVAIARTAHLASVMSRSVRVIPTVAWRTGVDLGRWTDWFEAGGLSALAIHLNARVPSEWNWMLRALSVLAELFTKTPRLVAVGPSTADRIIRVADAWPGRLSIASSRPWQLAQKGRLLQDDLRPIEVPMDDRSKDQLVMDNTRVFSDVVTEILRQPCLRLASAS